MTGNPKNNKIIEPVLPRRSFLNWVWACLSVFAAGEIVWAVTSFLRPSAMEMSNTDGDRLMTAGPVKGFELNTVTAFPRGHFYLARLADGGFLALSQRCTHLGCTVPWVAGEKRFVCPCHSSIFDIRGTVIQSPASRPLDILPVVIENDIVLVNIRSTLKRSGFLKEQATYPVSLAPKEPKPNSSNQQDR
jgi:cytochrome b6-f complex iron-sulfur subunit